MHKDGPGRDDLAWQFFEKIFGFLLVKAVELSHATSKKVREGVPLVLHVFQNWGQKRLSESMRKLCSDTFRKVNIFNHHCILSYMMWLYLTYAKGSLGGYI